MTTKGKKYITNGVIQKTIYPHEEMPEGFHYGKLPMSDEAREINRKSHLGKKLSADSVRKRQETFRKKYGVSSCAQLSGVREKISHRLSSKEVQSKMKSTCMERYGVSNVLQSPEFKKKMRSTNEARHGNPNFNNKEKEYLTRKSNGTLGLFETQPEQQLCKMLRESYGDDNVETQYRSNAYPFKCDFYINSLDCYIEYHGFWTHGGHPYDPNSDEDKLTINLWKERGYQNAIYTWTDLDVRKRSYLDKINLIIFYPDKHDDIVYSFEKLKAELDKLAQ